MLKSEFFDLYNVNDFKHAILKLQQNNINPIEFKLNTYEINNFDNIIKKFYGISEKNRIKDIQNFFIYDKEEYSQNIYFDINKLIELKESKTIQKELIIKYIKTLKYASHILEPIKFVKNSSSKTIILNEQSSNLLTLEKYVFINKDSKKLEIIIPGQSLKNPIYGLLHYVNFDIELFKDKEIKIDKYEKFNAKNNYSDLFLNLELDEYEYELNILNNEKSIKLTFYRNRDSESQKQESILVIEHSRDFFNKFNIIDKDLLKNYLDRLYQCNKRVYIYFQEYNNCIAVSGNGKTLILENDLFFLKKILQEVIIKKTIRDKALEYIKNIGKSPYNFYDDTLSNKKYYYKKYKFSSIIREVF